MTMSNLYKTIIALPLVFVLGIAQTETDAIEKARQAKEAAEKAAAEAAAATEAAIEQAAQRAASEARTEAKRKKEEEEARRLAEEQAAEEAELDAAAAKAAEEAKRKMAAELGLEYVDPNSKDDEVSKENETINESTVQEETETVEAKESSGYNLGLSGSLGIIQGNFFDKIPAGGSLVLTTPWGFDLGGLKFGISATLGIYPATHNTGLKFSPMAFGVGGNLTLAKIVFAEGHIGLVGEAMGTRGFAGVSLEQLMKKGLDLPFNVLVGAEGFLSTQLATIGGDGSGTYWGGLAFRIDYSL